MPSDCPLIEPEASDGGRLGERNGTKEEDHSACSLAHLSRFGACLPSRLL